MLVCQDSQEFLKTIEEYGLDIVYCDPPYALGSEVIIRKDGKVDYAKAADFMSKWEMPTGSYWEQWFNEAYRTLKHGGYLIMFGMDRQLLLFKYYAHLAGFVEQQSLYWYFISNFPKATDLSKMIDKNLGYEREKIGERKGVGSNNTFAMKNGISESMEFDSVVDITEPNSDLAKKYEGYKYSISPLKQTNETIMVFQKPCKTGSPLHDTLAYENGDKTITVSALNIDGNRVGTSDDLARINKDDNGMFGVGNNNNKAQQMKEQGLEYGGRYPAQTFIDSKVAERLDLQSGVSKSSVGQFSKEEYELKDTAVNFSRGDFEGYGDIGGCSKILHKCDYTTEDYDLYNYEPKVSSSERNAGCDEFETSQCVGGGGGIGDYLDDVNSASGKYGSEKAPSRNTHPTLKPIALNEKILKLFKTPNPQKICYPFAGAGSEIIGGIKAGFDDWIGCEINQEYVDIAEARIKYWKEEMTTQTSIFDFL
jgi:DNA modification methylase